MPDALASPKLPSPCQKICELNRQDICIGCARTRSEIGEWSRATPERQAQIWQLVRARRAAFKSGGLIGAADSANADRAQ